jgi:hypothetical protein
MKIVIVELERLEKQLQELQLSVTLRHPHLINGITGSLVFRVISVIYCLQNRLRIRLLGFARRQSDRE